MCLNICVPDAPINFAAHNRVFFECLTPQAVLKSIIKVDENAATAIFELSVIPKISKNKGNMAVAGIERKKSMTNSMLSYSFDEVPNIKPRGKPIAIASVNAAPTRPRVVNMSGMMAPDNINSTIPLIVSIVLGRKNVSITPEIDNKNQSKTTARGPITV
jgi:hypothetical protein